MKDTNLSPIIYKNKVINTVLLNHKHNASPNVAYYFHQSIGLLD